jgi:hypothetical protein
MKSDSIPAEWEAPKAMPDFLYWQGFDYLALEWKRTRRYKRAKRNVVQVFEYLFWRMNFVIWACCTIEAFVNSEGVALLEEVFYKDNIEKLGICQKIVVLYALKYRRRLESSHEAIVAVKKLFELRNRFVHPKTRNVRKELGRDDMRAKLDDVSPDGLRKVFWKVTALFEPDPKAEKVTH